MTSPHDPTNDSEPTAGAQPAVEPTAADQPAVEPTTAERTTTEQTGSDDTTQLPPFVFVPEDDGVAPVAGQLPIWDQPQDELSDPQPAPARARRWSRGHTVAAAVVAVGVLVAGGAAYGARQDDSTAQRATGQQPIGPGGAQQQPPSAQGQAPGQGQPPGGPGQDPLSSLGQLDVSQLGPLLSQLSSGRLDSDQLRQLLAQLGLPDHLDASQLQDLLSQLGAGGHLFDGDGDDDGSGGDGGGVHT